MNATIGYQLRLSAELHAALQRMAPARGINKFVSDLIAREAVRRGELPTAPRRIMPGKSKGKRA